MGRLLQKQQKNPQAIPYLERTIRLSEGSTHYIGASAALQLGYLYRDQGRPQKASEYFKKAMQYKKHEYKNSIDNKARAALTELAEN
jgi:tetratricopeptide (TPR) repeat protein